MQLCSSTHARIPLLCKFTSTLLMNQLDRDRIETLTPTLTLLLLFHQWFSFFLAFFVWFAIAPLLSEIKETLGLDKQQIWTSSIVGVGGTIAMRFILGPLCDKFGARILFSGVLAFAAIPTALTGTVNSATTLAILRLFIGVAGGSFVMYV